MQKHFTLILLITLIIITPKVCYAESKTVLLGKGQTCEFTNNSLEQQVIKTDNTYITNTIYDYVIYNKAGKVLEMGMSKQSLGVFEIQQGGCLIVSIVSTSEPLEFEINSQFINYKLSDNPALLKITINSGESYEIVNNGQTETNFEIYSEQPDLVSYNFQVYYKDGVQCLQNEKVNYNTVLEIPAEGKAIVTAQLNSQSLKCGGSYKFLSFKKANYANTIFQYEKIKQAKTDKEIIQELSYICSNLSEQQKYDDNIKEELLKYSEFGIQKISTKQIEINNNELKIDYKRLKEQIEKVRTARKEVEELYLKNKIKINRELETNVKVQVVGEISQLSAIINKDLSKNLSGIQNIKIDTGEVIATLKADNIKKEIGENNSITLKISKETKVIQSQKTELAFIPNQTNQNLIVSTISNQTSIYKVSFQKEEKSVNKLNENIKLAFPIAKGSSEYNCVFIVKGEDIHNAEPIGGKYTCITDKIEIETKREGRYFVKENKKSFNDIASKDIRMKKAVEILSAKGIINGRDDNNFDPDESISRAEFVKLIVRTLYYLDTDAKAKFKDVAKIAWYYPYVASSKKEGLIDGYPDNTFRGGNIISKQEIVKVCSASLNEKKKYTYPSDMDRYIIFKDNDSIPSWVKKYIALGVRESLITRRADGRFEGDKPMTRGEAVVILYRLFEKI